MNVTSTIDVGVDPMTAFTAFTDELEQWGGNGPIDAWDSSRFIGRRLRLASPSKRGIETSLGVAACRAFISGSTLDTDYSFPRRLSM